MKQLKFLPKGPPGAIERLSKGQITNNNKIQLQRQFSKLLCHILRIYSVMIDV